MLSRVAVEAPRTHNRRGVTGSSGRRREGGESEPRRPNMSRRVFASAVLLLVVMVGCGSCAAGIAVPSPRPLFEWKGINDGVTVESLGAPSLLKVGSDVFAVAEAQCKKGGFSFTGIASQPLKTPTADPPEEVLKKPKEETQVLEENLSQGQKKKLDVSRPTTAMKGSDIYMLAGAYNEVAASGEDVSVTESGLLLVKGSVNSGEGTNNKIDWKVTESSLQIVDAQLDSWTRLIGSGGSGVKMKDETLVFPVEGTKKAAVGTEVDVKTVSLIIYSKDNTDWKLSKGMPDGGCGVPSVVEWEEGKLMMMTACGDGRRRVYESGDMGESWTEALGTLSRVWGNEKDGKAKAVGSGFITATVGNDGDNRNVMLVTLPVYAEKVENEKGKLHLWLTDNTHIVDIGPVSGDDAAASSLLYNSGESTDEKKDELIALYEKKKDGEQPSPGMVSVLLTEQLKRVKEVLATWKEVDKSVSQLCTSLIAEKDPSTDTACGAVKITAGLVGFLSGKFSENTWRDEYLGVNATVNNKEGATNTSDGVTFTGRGAGAEWPVGKQGQNQLYRFANYNFTLVATVSIDGVPREGNTPIPLIGVRAGSNGNEEKTKIMELSYNSGKKWHVLCGDGKTDEVSSTWETGTPQHVVILLKNGTQGSVYVDGQRVGNGECALGSGESKEISHFYIGGDGENKESREEGVSVTVTNVLLYNRPWDEAEITALNPNKAPTPSPVNEPSQETAIETSTGQGKEEPRHSLGSSKGAGSGGSTADGDPTVETREGGTDGQKGEIHAQNGDVKAAALSSSLGNVSQGNDSDAGSVCGSGLLPLLLLLLLGLWGFAAL
ncbi:trans-sialidase [Trypanosoma cruzi cruzi]|uniref:Putative trans-sialidase, Group V n=1 Tax=Trypanosoma cruzi TaxID=5693 RepID=A0A2V2UPP9_TRYCR|nr:trans-sialidase [Trypanosoma cruzi cruzi]PWU86069.1 putative trans-sialidase, Group V [Trypanosoma cruzi]